MECENETIDEYLKIIRSECSISNSPFFSLSRIDRLCIEDPSMNDEIALQVLLHCQMKIELALMKFRQLPVKTICKHFNRTNPCTTIELL